MKKKSALFFILVMLCLCFFPMETIFGTEPKVDIEVLNKRIQEIYNVKSKCQMIGDWKELKQHYDISKKYAQWSFEHEAKRIKYLTDWSNDRGIKFTGIRSQVELKKVRNKGDMQLLSLDETYHVDYIYRDDADKNVNSFKVFLKHSVGLVNKDGKWLIARDWYSDCFENALGSYSGIHIGMPEEAPLNELEASCFEIEGKPQRYDREKAIAYADKYWVNYNSKYKNCNGIGGDCTNYVSQCIGDKEEGGAIAFDGSWFCVYPKHGRAEGSRAFVNTDAFKAYLVYSGRGRVIKRGDFKEVSKPTEDSAIGAAGKLQVGDLICYEEKGQIDHFSIITELDSMGYPMINSHTVERYHVPFDLGWQGKHIKFHLIRIAY